MDIQAVFGRNLRRARLAAGLSQEAMGACIGVGRAHVSLMELGRQNITLNTLWLVAEALKMHPMTFLDDRELSTPPQAPPKAPESGLLRDAD